MPDIDAQTVGIVAVAVAGAWYLFGRDDRNSGGYTSPYGGGYRNFGVM